MARDNGDTSNEAFAGDKTTTENRPVLLTGMSGAGLNTASRVLEDMGFFVSENLPPQIILELVKLSYSETPR